MFWLIWIAMMLAVPIGAGVMVWLRMRRELQEIAAAPQVEER